MGEVRGVWREGVGRWERRERETKREGAEAARGGGGYLLSGAPRGGTAGIQEWWKEGGGGEGISKGPNDLFRPGGTCASQPLIAAITLPSHGARLRERRTKICGERAKYDYC